MQENEDELMLGSGTILKMFQTVRYIELASLSLLGQRFQLAVAALFICIEPRAASLAT